MTSATGWNEKATAARYSAQQKTAQAKWHRRMAERAAEYRAGHLSAALELETDAAVDLAFAETCERWARQAA